jgi:hypothetical protein
MRGYHLENYTDKNLYRTCVEFKQMNNYEPYIQHKALYARVIQTGSQIDAFHIPIICNVYLRILSP